MSHRITYNLSHIGSVEALRREQMLVKQRLHSREEELKLKMYEIPAELAAAGVNSVIPGILRGKITDNVLNGGKKLINALIVPSSGEQGGIAGKIVKHRGLIGLLRKGIALWRGK